MYSRGWFVLIIVDTILTLWHAIDLGVATCIAPLGYLQDYVGMEWAHLCTVYDAEVFY